MVLNKALLRAGVLASVFAASALLSLPASAVTTTITVTGTAITVDCIDGSDPVCRGFTGGGSPAFPSSMGVLSPMNADLYALTNNNESTEAQALDILIDGLDDDDFVGTDGSRIGGGGGDSLMLFSDADYLVFKVGAGHFFLELTAPGEIKLVFDKNGQQAGGLSHVTSFGGTTTYIPLPASLPLLLAGLAGLGMFMRRRRDA